jgi:photosystem II stability/assembly factor-like uncharacterized protein
MGVVIMKFIRYGLPLLFFIAGILIITAHDRIHFGDWDSDRDESAEAAEAFQWWYAQRALPYDTIPHSAFKQAFKQYRTLLQEKAFRKSAVSISPWHSLGPNNVGGRVLSLAIDPVNSSVIWAGAASGGLWKSTSGGVGANAWTLVNTGFPTLSISTIAIDTADHNIMYIGTGEISYYQRALIGIRGARSSYGMGILKTTDGGTTWDTTSLTWTFPQITAVERIVINPKNHNTVYAATSEGTYRSTDRGTTWTRVHSEIVAMDLVINPVDTTILYVACGTYNSSPNPGIYKTTNSGSTWVKLTTGLPSSNFGRTGLSISPANPSIVYAGIADASSGGMIGLYRTNDAGTSWTLTSATNYVRDQGWYDNVVAVHPTNPAIVYCGGIDIYKSTDSGKTLNALSYWTAGYTSVPAGGPEGASNYVHADQHAIAFDPKNPSTMYFGCDGGVFQSTDGGSTFNGRNGGFITTQFYPGFATSTTDTTTAIGGLQDNGVLRFGGTHDWYKADGGDGGYCAIDPTNNSIMYDEYVYLTMSKSVDGGFSFSSITNGLATGASNANFIAPFIISPSSPNVLYAGANNVYKTTNGGSKWFAANGTSTLNGTNISAIGVSWTNPDTVIAGTGSGSPGGSPLFQIFSSTDGGGSWTNVTGPLPNRYPTDIKFDVSRSSWAYVSFSGYNTSHVFKTTDLGKSWIDISSNLPNLPAQTVLPDPNDTSIIYVGTDLGVFRTTDAGATWEDFSDGMPPAMILDLKICDANYSLRAATQGNGIYERYLPKSPTLTLMAPAGGEHWTNGDIDTIRWTKKYISTINIKFSSDSGSTWSTVASSIPASQEFYLWTISAAPTIGAMIGIYDSGDSGINDVSGIFTIQQAPDLYKGWNLVSIPVNPPDPIAKSLFPAAISNSYRFSDGYLQSETLQVGVGYWMKFPARQNISFSGDSVLADTIHLVAGWNLIGTIGHPMPAASVLQDPPSNINSKFFGYSQGYKTADTLRPVHGYWVKVKAPGTIVLSASESMRKSGEAPFEELSRLNSITVSDCNGNAQRLYFTDQLQMTNKEGYDLPPLPPAGCFDVRFTSQRMVEAIDGKILNYPVEIRGASQPITISWQLNESGGQYSLLNDGVCLAALHGSGSITITGMKTLNLALRGEGTNSITKPLSFSLYQNYPNPFNPSTSVRYDLPSDGTVSLKVFDLNGREIRTLVQKEEPAGEHLAIWDGNNSEEKAASTGIYFAVLKVGSYTKTTKMVLIR